MKKRKREQEQSAASNGVDTSKPTAVFRPTAGRAHTLSVALPGSIIANAQSHELKTVLAGHVARALAVFCVDEVVIFDDGQGNPKPRGNLHGPDRQHHDDHHMGEQSYTGYADPDHFLEHLLSYLETPPHLRKYLFPIHPNLKSAGTLPSLDMPHHMRADEQGQYREGVTVPAPDAAEPARLSGPQVSTNKSKKRKQSSTNGAAPPLPPRSYVEVGLKKRAVVQAAIAPHTRVTLKFASDEPTRTEEEHIAAEAVRPEAPREEAGYYWGYATRRAPSLSAVFTECPFDGGYDLTVGTSERGTPLDEITAKSDAVRPTQAKHTMIVLGGVAGLEAAVKADAELAGMGLHYPAPLFDYWVNLCPGQG
ncbi:MAG: hypothetical protein M1838_005713, partial [Thelocarpon superellum]